MSYYKIQPAKNPVPVMRDWLMIKRSGLISAGDQNFKSRVEISSQPEDDLVRSEFKVFFF